MKPCICGAKPFHADNSDIHPEYKARYHTVRHQVKCSGKFAGQQNGCTIQTAFYAQAEIAEHAWGSKGWVNNRRVA